MCVWGSENDLRDWRTRTEELRKMSRKVLQRYYLDYWAGRLTCMTLSCIHTWTTRTWYRFVFPCSLRLFDYNFFRFMSSDSENDRTLSDCASFTACLCALLSVVALLTTLEALNIGWDTMNSHLLHSYHRSLTLDCHFWIWSCLIVHSSSAILRNMTGLTAAKARIGTRTHLSILWCSCTRPSTRQRSFGWLDWLWNDFSWVGHRLGLYLSFISRVCCWWTAIVVNGWKINSLQEPM